MAIKKIPFSCARKKNRTSLNGDEYTCDADEEGKTLLWTN